MIAESRLTSLRKSIPVSQKGFSAYFLIGEMLLPKIRIANSQTSENVRGLSKAARNAATDSLGSEPIGNLREEKTMNADPRKMYEQPPSEEKQNPPGSEKAMSPKVDHGESTYQGTGRLKDRHALVTGADSGIGRAVALAFAREGADVAISYLSEDEDAQETERLIIEAGRKAVLLPGDIGERTVSAAVARKAIDALGGIDTLVNNAAFQRSYDNFEDISDDEFEETYRVNVFAMFRLCKALLPQMKPGGSIINTGSIQSFDPSASLIAYASSKAAIVSFTRSLLRA